MNDKLLTVSEAAARLSVSQRTIHRLMADGRLPFVMVTGDARRIKTADLQQFVRQRRVTAAK